MKTFKLFTPIPPSKTSKRIKEYLIKIIIIKTRFNVIRIGKYRKERLLKTYQIMLAIFIKIMILR